MIRSLLIILLTLLGAVSAAAQALQQFFNEPPDSVHYIDPDRNFYVVGQDTIALRVLALEEPVPSGPLTEKDFEEVAAELGVEVAAIKAVVEIEAGKAHQGFWSEGKPLINFDLNVFRQMARKRGIALGKYGQSHSAAFNRPNISRYGSRGAAVQARYDAAADIDSIAAIEGTFWGMFQIGGFNWRKSGANSPEDFVRLMSRSERDQLELFARFITNAGLLPALKAKNWAAFARGYNGPSYASRGYHTKLAAAYSKYKKQQ